MFKLSIHDRNGIELSQGDIVKISDGVRITFFAEVKYLPKEQVITPFHTFSFSSVEKVDSVPDNAILSSEERYNIWYLPSTEGYEDLKAQEFDKFLTDWRTCEYLLEKRMFRISPLKE